MMEDTFSKTMEWWNHAIFHEKKGKIYLAARYSRKEEMRKVACILMLHGYEITSSWLNEMHSPDTKVSDLTEWGARDYAQQDLADIDRSNILVLFTDDSANGVGCHFEAGYAYAKGIPVITIGPRTSIFYFLANIKNIEALGPSWDLICDS